MCGIAGLIADDPELIARCLEKMGNAQRHRGPDDAGAAVVPMGRRFLGLHHRRLSIIDLSPAGHQPMVHPATGSQIIFNGEIYNFQRLRDELDADGVQRNQSSGDTEVLLNGLVHHGEDFVARLHGMFAFAFYDARDQSLLLSRDSVGIKPLYVARTPHALVFASEVRAILASGLVQSNIDWKGLAGLKAYGCVQHPHTMIEGVASFPAAHVWRIGPDGWDNAPAPKRYWDFPAIDHRLTEAEVVPQIRDTFDAAVRDHLIADVPVGVFLSSGLDSTAIAAFAARHTSRLRSFTVGFSDQPDLSEASFAAETARQLGLEHTDIQILSKDAEQVAVEWLDSLDQPSMDGLNVYLISKVVRREGITVALSGQGGDELFGGYPSFEDVPRLRQAMNRIRFLPGGLRALLLSAGGIGKSDAYRQKLGDIARSSGSILDLYLHRRRTKSDGQLASSGLIARQLGLAPSFQPIEAVRDLHLPDDEIASISRLETLFYQHNMLLRDADTNGMAHSLEIRVPVLDQRLLDLVHRIPGKVRLPNGAADKHLLRVALQSAFRPELLQQKKKGFTLPIRRWMLTSLRELCEDSIDNLTKTNLLRPAGVRSVWERFLAEPESPIWTRAFTLVVLGRWLKNNRVNVAGREPALA